MESEVHLEEKETPIDLEGITDHAPPSEGEHHLNHIPTPVLVTDTDYTVRFINHAGANLIGEPREACIGQKCYDLFCTPLCNTPQCALSRAIEENLTVHTDSVARLPSGDNPIRYTATPYTDQKGDLIGTVGSITEIADEYLALSEMMNLQEEIQAGNTHARLEPLLFQGETVQRMVQEINATLDAITEPLNIAITSTGQISNGQMLEEISTEYQGQYATLVNNINRCRDGYAALDTVASALRQVAVNDYTCPLNGRYPGIIAEIAESISMIQQQGRDTVERIERIADGDLSDLESLKTNGNHSEDGTFTPALIRMMEVIENMNIDFELLTDAIAAGKITTRIDTAHHQGRYRTIVQSINTALDMLTGPYSEINRAISDIDSSTRETGRGTAEIAKATQKVAITSQQCAELNAQFMGKIEEIERQISDLSASNEEIASSSIEVLERTEQTVLHGKDGVKLGQETREKMASVEEISQQSVRDISELNAQMTEISKIVKLINDIASQTNLLALNAAIEAARAGEHGRGFAVVAGEIRNLAGESKKASQNIEDLIASIIANTNKTAANMEKGYYEISIGVESVNRTIEALNNIVSGAEAASCDIGEIAKAIDGQASVANQIMQAMENGTALNRENLDNIQELAAISEETSASTEEIGGATYELSTITGRLKETMGKFEV
ncbi:methyl-accepting chemotaxis protein [Methanofollis fontis]|nr:methyl-accepting chemotaxis protein [Methanofollis fontis]